MKTIQLSTEPVVTCFLTEERFREQYDELRAEIHKESNKNFEVSKSFFNRANELCGNLVSNQTEVFEDKLLKLHKRLRNLTILWAGSLVVLLTLILILLVR